MKFLKIKRRYFLTAIIILLMNDLLFAQTNQMDSSSVAAGLELKNLQNAADAYDDMQFDILIIASDSAVNDTLSGTCSMKGDFYRTTFDSVIQIQNNYMHLDVHYEGKVLVVSKPTPFNKQFLRGGIEEGLFQQMNVNTMSITSSGGNKTLGFNFLPESEFDTYTITYNPTTYRVSEVFVKMKMADANGNYSLTNFNTIKIQLQNFQAISSLVSFETTEFIIATGGSSVQKQTAYNDYQLINMLGEDILN